MNIEIPQPLKLLRQVAINCAYGHYSDLSGVYQLPYVPFESMTWEVSNEAYQMALFMNQHPGIELISYEELKKVMIEPKTKDKMYDEEDFVKAPPLLRSHRNFPFIGPLVKQVTFPSIFLEIGEHSGDTYWHNYADYIDFKKFSDLAYYLHEHRGIAKITYGELCGLVGTVDDTNEIIEKVNKNFLDL